MTERLNVLVSGRSGQVASSLFEAEKPEGIKIFALGRPDLDITDKTSIEAVFDRIIRRWILPKLTPKTQNA